MGIEEEEKAELEQTLKEAMDKMMDGLIDRILKIYTPANAKRLAKYYATFISTVSKEAEITKAEAIEIVIGTEKAFLKALKK